MSHVLIARKVQTSKDNSYQSYECNPYFFYCNPTVPCGYSYGIQDHEIGKQWCPRGCSDQNICAKPDRKECTIGLDSNGRDPLIRTVWDEKAPNIECAYELDKIDRVEQLQVYASKFKDSPYIDTMMGAFCGKHVSTDCASGLDNECSRYLSTDEEGKMCRQWMATLSRDSQDALMRNYCLSNSTKDCKCINRSTDPEYNRMKSLSNFFSDNCWYKPCSNSESIYLVPHRLTENKCATNICQQIIDAHAQGNVTIEGNTSQINCNFKADEFQPNPPQTPQSTSWFKKYWYIVVGILAALLLLIL